jgi:predicted short-subunit dehydrogenase-like oxidoreductase (DUF2520 family)
MTGRLIAQTTIKNYSVAILGAGSLATFLATALNDAGFDVTEIVTRDSTASRRRAHSLAAKVGAHVVTLHSGAIAADLLWFCVPDREIRSVASSLADHTFWRPFKQNKVRFAFHSSGALLSHELGPLRKARVAVASVHPLMTFVAGAHPSLKGVPFALEGDRAASQVARQVVRALGGEPFSLSPSFKAAYHAWATMTSPLFLGFLVTLEEAARAAGLKPHKASRMSLPIIRQTLANYARLGPAHSFSGPLSRGDAETVAKHLASLQKHPGLRNVYVALARQALRRLPVRNPNELNRLLRTREKQIASK